MNKIDRLRQQIIEYLGLDEERSSPDYQVVNEEHFEEYTRFLIHYSGSENDEVPAYLLIPNHEGIFPAVLVHHQHNGERHLGKSEVCGLIGNPLQAFGETLVKKGFVILAPDSICFEDRRKNKKGTTADGDNDFSQHYNEMCYRIIKGSSLMKKVIDDANLGIDLLKNNAKVDKNRIGVLGHSYGGNTVIFQMAVNEDIMFGCSSGAACTYKNKMQNGTGIEMAEVIPGFYQKYDLADLVKCIAPRHLLLVSSIDDKYSKDAIDIEFEARRIYEEFQVGENLDHQRYNGGHALTQARFDYINNWMVQVASKNSRVI